MGHSDTEVQAVLRACQLLKAFRYRGEVLRLPELCERTGLSKTTVFRIMQTLVKGGLVARVSKGGYCRLATGLADRPVRIGFAAQTDSEFSRQVTAGMEKAAAKEGVHLITVNNHYSPKKAVQNAEFLIRERVDLVIEFQTYERVAPIIAAKFLAANIPVIALEVPHPGATYFGANNYQAGLIAGKALGRWIKTHWNGRVEQVLLLELPIAGSLPQLRISGFLAALKQEIPAAEDAHIVHLDARGDFQRNFEMIRKFLRRGPVRRTAIGTVNDIAALAALRAFEEAGAADLCAVVGQNGIIHARMELRRPGSHLVGTVAYFPERYGDDVIPLALAILQRKAVPSAVFVKHVLLTPENVDVFYPLDTREQQAYAKEPASLQPAVPAAAKAS